MMPIPPVDLEKAVVDITQGSRLLVFLHTGFPEEGIQIPAGMIIPGEDLAALRFARLVKKRDWCQKTSRCAKTWVQTSSAWKRPGAS